MKNMIFSTNKLFVSLVFLLISCSGLFAQDVQVETNFEPYSGQEGKDVVWVPTPQSLVETMLNIAGVTSRDFVIDLGSGDGRTVITAAKRGAKARGFEFNPNMVALSKRNAAKEGVGEKAEFVQGDLFEADLSQATVITMFLLPEINLRLRPFLLELKPGTRIVSNTFQMDEWIPDSTARAGDVCESWCDAYMWIIPAKVGGKWKIPQGELDLNQEFQMVSGTMTNGGRTRKISSGKLWGNKLTFICNNEKFSGVVNGNTIELSGQSNSKWIAEKN